MNCLPTETAVVFILDTTAFILTHPRSLSSSDAFESSPQHSLHFNLIFNSPLTVKIQFHFWIFLILLHMMWAGLRQLQASNPFVILLALMKWFDPSVFRKQISGPFHFVMTQHGKGWDWLNRTHEANESIMNNYKSLTAVVSVFCFPRTLYSVAYRQVSRVASSSYFYPECCPGWRRFHSHNCNQGNLERHVISIDVDLYLYNWHLEVRIYSSYSRLRNIAAHNTPTA